MLTKVVFLDRDGTINRDSHAYIKRREEFEFLPGSLEAIKMLTQHGFVNMVITNQSALSRQLISSAELEAIHKMMARTAAHHGGEIRDVFYCPHMPADGCACRKPEPGLIFQAREKYAVDLSSAVMVGDSLKDIECARRAGCGQAVLVRSGLDEGVDEELHSRQIRVDFVAKDLHEAAGWIIARPRLKTTGGIRNSK